MDLINRNSDYFPISR